MLRFTALLTFLLIIMPLSARDPLTECVLSRYDQDATFHQVAPLFGDPNPPDMGKRPEVSEADWFTVDRSMLSEIIAKGHPNLRFEMATSDQEWTFDMIRTELVSEGFVVETNTGKTYSNIEGVHYRGIISGREDSFVAMSIYPDQVMAVAWTPEDGDMVLGRSPSAAKSGSHVFYKSNNLSTKPKFSCSTEEPKGYRQRMAEILSQGDAIAAGDKCVEVYLEADYALYVNKGSVVNTVAFLSGLYNVVATIYERENITTRIGRIGVWTTPDSYSTTNAGDALYQFASTGVSEDLAHLVALGGQGLGGVGYLDVLCNPFWKYAYSNISSGYLNLPDFSWSVMVMAHEMGHNLGSPHTQSCSWNGGPLDNCVAPEGSCSPGPPPPSTGGTIMSYCHITSVGIDLMSGFGQQPGDLIRARVGAAGCAGACDLSNNLIGKELRFRAWTWPADYMRQRNTGYVHKDGDDGSNTFKLESTFKIIPGLAGKGISFQSVTNRNYYLRHNNAAAVMSAYGSDPNFINDATWMPRPGIADANGYSFETINYPGRFLRHQDGWVRTDYNDLSSLFSYDATWAAEQAWPEPLYQAESSPSLGHKVGRADGDGWSASTSLDWQDHLVFGPYATDLGVGDKRVTFRALLDNVTAGGDVMYLDVWDATAGQQLAWRAVPRSEFQQAWQYQDVNLDFNLDGRIGHAIETRIWWTDISYVKVDYVHIKNR